MRCRSSNGWQEERPENFSPAFFMPYAFSSAACRFTVSRTARRVASSFSRCEASRRGQTCCCSFKSAMMTRTQRRFSASTGSSTSGDELVSTMAWASRFNCAKGTENPASKDASQSAMIILRAAIRVALGIFGGGIPSRRIAQSLDRGTIGAKPCAVVPSVEVARFYVGVSSEIVRTRIVEHLWLPQLRNPPIPPIERRRFILAESVVNGERAPSYSTPIVLASEPNGDYFTSLNSLPVPIRDWQFC
jgi:hypothetical protein